MAFVANCAGCCAQQFVRILGFSGSHSGLSDKRSNHRTPHHLPRRSRARSWQLKGRPPAITELRHQAILSSLSATSPRSGSRLVRETVQSKVAVGQDISFTCWRCRAGRLRRISTTSPSAIDPGDSPAPGPRATIDHKDVSSSRRGSPTHALLPADHPARGRAEAGP